MQTKIYHRVFSAFSGICPCVFWDYVPRDG